MVRAAVHDGLYVVVGSPYEVVDRGVGSEKSDVGQAHRSGFPVVPDVVDHLVFGFETVRLQRRPVLMRECLVRQIQLVGGGGRPVGGQHHAKTAVGGIHVVVGQRSERLCGLFPGVGVTDDCSPDLVREVGRERVEEGFVVTVDVLALVAAGEAERTTGPAVDVRLDCRLSAEMLHAQPAVVEVQKAHCPRLHRPGDEIERAPVDQVLIGGVDGLVDPDAGPLEDVIEHTRPEGCLGVEVPIPETGHCEHVGATKLFVEGPSSPEL